MWAISKHFIGLATTLLLFHVLIFLAVRYVGSYLADQGLNLHPLQWKAKVKVSQSCPTLCNPMGYAVHGILQARILRWVAFPFSRGSSQLRDRTQASCIAGRFFIS